MVLLTTSVGIAKAERAVGDKFKSGKLWYKVTSTSPKEVEVVPKSDSWPYWKNDPEAPKGKINIPTEVQGYKVTAIGRYAFAFCENLTSVEVHVPKIEFRAFYHNEGLREIHLYDKVKTIESQVFNGNKKLHTIKVSNGNSKFCSENGVLFDKDKTKLIKYPVGKKAVAYEIPNSVKEIEEYAFLYSNLEYITIPNSVKKISLGAFLSSKKLKSIVSYVENVSSVVVEADAFKDVDKNSCKLRVPSGKENDYKNAQQWKDFNNIVRYELEKGDRFKEGKLMYEITYISHSSLSGLVRIVPQFSTYPYWDENTENIRPKGDIVIGNVDYKNYSFKPSELGAGCFYGSEELKSIDMSYSFVEKIKESAFAECYGLEKVVLGSNIKELGNYAFGECSGIKEINSKIKDINSVTMYDGLFIDDIYGTCKVVVTYGKVEDYKNAKHWKNFTNIKNGVNMDKFIILTVVNGKEIMVKCTANSDNTPIKIVSSNNGSLEKVVNSTSTFVTFTSSSSKIALYGDIKTLNIGYENKNNITGVDIRNNTSLEELSCYDTKTINSLKLGNNTQLRKLNCTNNAISDLDVSGNSALKEIYCSYNKITALNVSENGQLEKLYCHSNKISQLDVSNNTKLRELGCGKNHLTSLVVSNNTELRKLRCGSNNLTSLDVSNCPNLWQINCAKNNLDRSAVDNLFCSLSNRSASTQSGLLYLVDSTTDANYNDVLQSNKQNALDKNWKVLYYHNGTGNLYNTDIPATTGNYVCNPVAVTSVQLNETAKTILKDEEFTLTATVLPADATNKAVTWSSDKSDIATVDENGKVKGVGFGKATITATTQDDNKTATCEVTVKDNTGLDEVEKGGIRVYPNPVKDVLHIDMVDSNDIQVEIYNTAGDKLVDVRNKNRISVSRLLSGVYFVKVTTSKGVYSKKLIKK